MTAINVRSIAAPELGERVILAIDTSLGTSVALGAAGNVTEVSSDDPRGHAEAIGTLIARVFAERGIDPASVTHVTAGMGPGPFTGLRVGIAAANAFALGRGLTTLPLVSHDAAALEQLESGATAGVRVVQDAKRRELFVSDYTSLDWAGIPERAGDPHLAAREGYESVTNELWP
ncbi:MAG: tRNA (adenosine(37)-N6)-threonylcarbamoyltransferase complex dimerization subunit type 1 TsaB, partial [Leucobacter sp.]|nr:tRNA (adenosine(37)-N6)-threonylcarbamoyltransferase complex dimerization subunit type 1 TsaB [Leucobacter sp.]